MKIIAALLLLTSICFADDLSKAFDRAEKLTIKAINDHNGNIIDVRFSGGNGHLPMPRGQPFSPSPVPVPEQPHDPDDDLIAFHGILSGGVTNFRRGEWNALYTTFSKWRDIEVLRCARHQEPDESIYDNRWAKYDIGVRVDLSMQFEHIYRNKPHFGPPCS